MVNGPWNFAVSSNLVDNVIVRGCFLGVDAAGAAAVGGGIGFYGYLGTGVTVGGPAPADRNLISGNTDNGVKLERCTDCLVQGNLYRDRRLRSRGDRVGLGGRCASASTARAPRPRERRGGGRTTQGIESARSAPTRSSA